MELLCGLMVRDMKENSIWTIFKGTGFTFGLMIDNMKACGKAIKCMEEESLPGQMVENNRVSTIWTKNKARESSHDQMEGNIMANG